ncbi:MAG: hypothetical protein ACFE68_06780 [Candidatus Hodarchaeota archaeon]
MQLNQVVVRSRKEEPIESMFHDKDEALSVFREKIHTLSSYWLEKVGKKKEKGWRIKPARNFDLMF